MVGAGQLARMTYQASIPLGIGFRVLADRPDDSAALVCPGVTVGDYHRLDDLLDFAAGCDVLTFDHEHVPGEHLAELAGAGVTVAPGGDALRYAQDKLAMRDELTRLGAPCPRYAPVASPEDVAAFAAQAGWPVVLKAVRGGYDGRGVWVCDGPDQAAEVLGYGVALLAEEYVPFVRELAALVARSPHRQGAAYPVVQTVQREGVCREVLAPAPGLAAVLAEDAQRLALELADALGVTGLLAVELFETPRGLLVNELAMRPHNSGHWTIEGARTSQFEQHLRAVLDLPLGAPQPAAPQVVMANVFGAADLAGAGPDVYDRYIHVMAADPGVKVHMYGKAPRPGRKIGHVTVAGSRRGVAPRPGLPGGQLPGDRQGAGRVSGPLVGVVMGSDSDWPVMQAAGAALDEFGVPYEADVVSAHRMPHDMIRYGSEAEGRGLRVIIAGAGGAAHLPGMLAAVTPLPVIGVPVPLKYLDGLDSLLSIVQMPGGIPVATVAVGGARNAGLLAVRILGAGDDTLRAADDGLPGAAARRGGGQGSGAARQAGWPGRLKGPSAAGPGPPGPTIRA